MSIVRIPAAAGAALVIAALLTGCATTTRTAAADRTTPAAAPTSSDPTSSDPTSSDPTSSAPTSSAPADPAAGSPAAGGGTVATGTDLKAFLPAAASLPAGWTLSGTGNEFDTGTKIMDPGTPQLPQKACAGLTNASGRSFSIDYRASFASEDVKDAKNNTVNVTVAAYHPGDAAKLLDEIRAYVGRCASYTTNAVGGGSVSMTASAKAVAGFGDEGIDFKNVPQGRFVTQETVIARVGDTVLFVDGSDAAGSLPDLMQLAGPLAKTVK